MTNVDLEALKHANRRMAAAMSAIQPPRSRRAPLWERVALVLVLLVAGSLVVLLWAAIAVLFLYL